MTHSGRRRAAGSKGPKSCAFIQTGAAAVSLGDALSDGRQASDGDSSELQGEGRNASSLRMPDWRPSSGMLRTQRRNAQKVGYGVWCLVSGLPGPVAPLCCRYAPPRACVRCLCAVRRPREHLQSMNRCGRGCFPTGSSDPPRRMERASSHAISKKRRGPRRLEARD